MNIQSSPKQKPKKVVGKYDLVLIFFSFCRNIEKIQVLEVKETFKLVKKHPELAKLLEDLLLNKVTMNVCIIINIFLHLVMAQAKRWFSHSWLCHSKNTN